MMPGGYIMKPKTTRAIAAVLLFFSLLTGCSAINDRLNVSSDTSGEGGVTAPTDQGLKPDFVPPDYNNNDKTVELGNEQKLVKTATIAMTAKNIQTAQTEIDLIAKRYSGYVYYMQQSQTSEKRYLTITIKVATANFDTAIEEIKKLGTTSNVTLDVADVTTQFIDTEARIKTLKIKEETLIGILAKATEIQDILAIESSLQQTRQEIESYEGQLNALKNSTQFSRITVQVSDETGLATTEEPESAWDRFRNNFSKGLRYWADTAVDVISGIIFLLPVLLPLAVILFIARKVVRRNPNHWSNRLGPDGTPLYHRTPNRTAEQSPPADPDQTPKSKS